MPLRSDLADDMRAWIESKHPSDLVFYVPMGLLRIMNRDLEAAGIDKIDELDGRVHIHALRAFDWDAFVESKSGSTDCSSRDAA